MRCFLTESSLRGIDAAVCDDHCQRIVEECPQVVFLHCKAGHVHVKFLALEQVLDGLPLVLAGNLAALVEVLAGVFLVARGKAGGNQDALRTAEPLDSSKSILADDLFCGRILESCKDFL